MFDGISCGQVALNNLGITEYNYFAAEIKKEAIYCTKVNYPNTIHIGDVRKIKYEDGILKTEVGEYKIGKIDLLIGGSPCQDLSPINSKKLGLNGEKSKLFWEFLRILKEVQPKYFLLENTKMSSINKEIIDKELKTGGVLIDSNLVSFQNRKRLYWSNVYIPIPKDEKISFQDYKERNNENLKKYKVPFTPSRIKSWNSGNNKTSNKFSARNITCSEKIDTITRKQDRTPNSGLIEFEDFCRFLTQEELELGQTLPRGYTSCLSYFKAQDVIGDGWTVKVIEHIFNQMNLKGD